MKKLLKKYSSLLLLCLSMIPAELPATPALQTTKKQVVKTYTDLKNERLIINNQYGDVIVKTWHQPKITVVITLTARAKTNTAVNKLLNRVNIAADRNEDQISITSLITKPVKSSSTDTMTNAKSLPEEQCNISYEVFLPSGTSLTMLNKFGNIVIGDYRGAVDLENKFGNITAGVLTGFSKVAVEQGDIELKRVGYANLKAKAFGIVKIESVEEKINGTFSSGNLLDINLSASADSTIIDADNVQQINLRGAAATNADYNVKTILSKLINESTLQFKELTNGERKPQSKTGVDSLTTLLKNKKGVQGGSVKDLTSQKKKLQATLISQLKKLREYKGTSGNGKGKVSIKVAFSVLNIFN